MNAQVSLSRKLRAALEQVTARLAKNIVLVPALAPAPIRPAAVLARRILPVLALSAAAGLAAAPASAGWYESDTWADGRLVDVQIRVDGAAAPLFWSPQGDSRRYFEAFAGRNYSIVVRNTTGQRVGVLLAVDGLNVVNGERTRLSAGESMYVLDPYESATIRGWRTSLESIRRFVFVDEKRSYAERTGQANSDMGWIRVLAFREQRPMYEPRGNEYRFWDGPRSGFRDGGPSGALPAPKAQAGEPQAAAPETRERDQAPQASGEVKDGLGKAGAARTEQNFTRRDEGGSFPGTGWGEQRTDRVREVEFRGERTATDHLVLRYEYASGLRALGIIPGRDRLGERDGGGNLGFAKPPRW